uniref:BAR domain-containing protein n=1 Tax=Romanomermis culicivorax TaxID=13658 RepID=A0A915JQU9_ROMCU
MADVLMKTIRKKTLRTKESLRETFGKVDRTTDEQFEDCCNDFNKQQKERTLNQASKGLYEAVREVYEPHWEGVEHVKAITHIYVKN